MDNSKLDINACEMPKTGVLKISSLHENEISKCVQTVEMLSAQVLFPTLLYFYWYEKAQNICP